MSNRLKTISTEMKGYPDWQKVLGTEDGSRPSFSPDDGWIVFRRPRDGNVIKVAADLISNATGIPPNSKGTVKSGSRPTRP